MGDAAKGGRGDKLTQLRFLPYLISHEENKSESYLNFCDAPDG